MKLDLKNTKLKMPVKNETDAKEPMTKMMMRLPRSLALEFQQTYLQLAALHLQKHGKKLFIQDCHIEMVQEWIQKQKRKLAEAQGSTK